MSSCALNIDAFQFSSLRISLSNLYLMGPSSALCLTDRTLATFGNIQAIWYSQRSCSPLALDLRLTLSLESLLTAQLQTGKNVICRARIHIFFSIGLPIVSMHFFWQNLGGKNKMMCFLVFYLLFGYIWITFLLYRISVTYIFACLFFCTSINFRILVRPQPCVSRPILATLEISGTILKNQGFILTSAIKTLVHYAEEELT